MLSPTQPCRAIQGQRGHYKACRTPRNGKSTYNLDHAVRATLVAHHAVLHRIEVVGDGTGLVAAGEAMHAQLGVDWTSDAMFVMKGQRSYKKCSEDHWLPNR